MNVEHSFNQLGSSNIWSLSDLQSYIFRFVNFFSLRFILSLIYSVDEFAEAFIEVLKEVKNGSVWIIDGGKFKEFTCSRPWYDIAVQSNTNWLTK